MKLRRIAQLLGFERDRTREPLFGLSREQAADLREMRASAGFRAYTDLLDTAITLYGESVLASRDDATLHEMRGMVLGLRKAASIVDEALRHAEEIAAREQRQRDSAKLEPDASRIALFGSPAFGRGNLHDR